MKSGKLRWLYSTSAFATIEANLKKGGHRMTNELQIRAHGIVSIEDLSEEEKRAFYAAMLVRLLALYREKQEGVK